MYVYIFGWNIESPCDRPLRAKWTLEVSAVQNTLYFRNKGYANALQCYVTLKLTILFAVMSAVSRKELIPIADDKAGHGTGRRI